MYCCYYCIVIILYIRTSIFHFEQETTMLNSSEDFKKKSKNITFNHLCEKKKKTTVKIRNNDEEVYHKLKGFEHPNALNRYIFKQTDDILSTVKNLKSYYSNIKTTIDKIDQIISDNKHNDKYREGEIGDKFRDNMTFDNLKKIREKVNLDYKAIIQIDSNLNSIYYLQK